MEEDLTIEQRLDILEKRFDAFKCCSRYKNYSWDDIIQIAEMETNKPIEYGGPDDGPVWDMGLNTEGT
jgi:hypothetical protein